MNEFKILEDLVRINTINDKDNNEFVKYISKRLERKGFKIELVTDFDGKSCLIATSSKECGLCFLGHSDTVPYANGWKTNPFELIQKGSKLYGLGVCDMKGGIAAFLDALEQMDIKKIDKGIMVVITYDEEISFKGINLIKDRTDIPNNIIIGEPTNLIPITYCKGCMEYSLSFFGKSVHSSNVIKGENAILKANECIKELNKFALKLKKTNNDKFDIPYTTMNISTIKGGTCINMVPDECKITFDFRTILNSHHELIKRKIAELCKKYDCKRTILTDVFPSNNNNKEGIDEVEKILNFKSKGVNYVTEGNFLIKKNIFIIGPGPITAHEINESISISTYNKTVDSYKKMINYFCKSN